MENSLNRDDAALQAVYILRNPQAVASPSLKMYAALRGFTRQNFIWNSRKYIDIPKSKSNMRADLKIIGYILCYLTASLGRPIKATSI